MAVQTFIDDLNFSQSEIMSKYTQDYLKHFSPMARFNLDSGTLFNFNIHERSSSKKINPIIRQATIDDIDEIIFTYKDIYEGSYPYKEMEDPDVIKEMIRKKDVEWFVFTHPQTGETCGSFTFMLDFKEKLGYARGLVVKKKFLGDFDILKACIGCYVANYIKYEGKIFRWHSENRTAHAKVQYITRHGGFHPIAFYPNKDCFYGRVESDVLAVSYDSRALTNMRSPETPCIIPEALGVFYYADRRYKLGDVDLYHSIPQLDAKKVEDLNDHLRLDVSRDRFGYEKIKISVEGTDSFISFLYTPSVRNIEKTKYHVSNLDELFVLGLELTRQANLLGVRYVEVFVGAHQPEHQKIFLELGLSPKGYVPSWKYDGLNDCFEDCIVFNHFKGKIDEKIQLLNEEEELLCCLDLD